MPPQSGQPSGQTPNQAPKPKKPALFSGSWTSLSKRATTIASIASLFAFLILGGAILGYFLSQANKKAPVSNSPTLQTLSQSDLNKLGVSGQNLGSSGQVLSIGADALFRGKASVVGDLSIGGHLNANGPVTLSQLNITGNTAATGLNVGSNLVVTGTTTLQNAVTVSGLANFNSGINVVGAASVGSLNAGSIAVRNISISGPLTVSHLVTQGPAPTIAANSVGAGGTVSISGDDTAGQININTGTGPGTTLATITFRAAYGATVHIALSPITSGAAAAQAYVTRNNGGFQVHANTAPAGSTLSFDYVVMQ